MLYLHENYVNNIILYVIILQVFFKLKTKEKQLSESNFLCLDENCFPMNMNDG